MEKRAKQLEEMMERVLSHFEQSFIVSGSRAARLAIELRTLLGKEGKSCAPSS
ncbi:hypothetical protein D3C78_1926180 [compost metagenome]